MPARGASSSDAEHTYRLVVSPRTYENGSLGTDHGRGFAAMVLGGSIKGGKFYTEWPGLTSQDSDILGPSGLTVKVDFRSVFAEVLSKALANRKIEAVFPGFSAQEIGFVQQSKQAQVL